MLLSIITCIITAILSTIIKIIIEEIRSIKDKPRFFIYELFFKGFSTGDIDKKYQMKGRFVGDTKHYYQFKSMSIKLPYDCKWEKEATKCHCYKWFHSKRQWDKTNDTDNNIVTNIKNDTLTIGYSEDLGKFTTYDVVGNYTVPNAPNDLSYSSFEVFSKKNEEDKKKEELKIIKCPNIRKGWLLFYILFSIFVLLLGAIAILGCINNLKHFVNANSQMYFVIGVFGLLLLTIMVFFVCVSWKALSAYFVLIKMKKFGIPAKTEKVAQKMLVPTIFEFMTGTETIDNIM